MIITLSGEAGSGKSSCAKGLASFLSLKHYSIGDLMRQIAVERNISLESLSSLAEHDSSIDKALDEKQKLLGKNEDQFVLDGRLSGFFIPHAIKIFLTATIEKRASRIHKAKRNLEPSENISVAKKNLIDTREIVYAANSNFNKTRCGRSTSYWHLASKI